MQENNYNLGTRLANGELYPSGTAYIVIPSDVSRAKYIKNCYKTSTVSIYSEHNGFFNRVPIDIMSLNFIEFPQNVNEFGSPVFYTIDSITNRPVISGMYSKSDQVCDLKENQFKFRRELNGKFVEISGSPDGNYLALNVSSDKGGEVSINVGSKDESGALNINISGSINITASGKTTIKQFEALELVTVNKENADELALMKQTSKQHKFYDEEHDIITGKYRINEGEEPFILGKAWKEFMDNFIDEVGNSTVTTQLGQMPLLNKAQIVAYKEKTEKLLSQIGFIDK